MADEQVEILLKTTADQTGTKQTVAGLEEVKKAGKSANDDLAKGAEALTLKKKNLLDMVKGLGFQFPILGSSGDWR